MRITARWVRASIFFGSFWSAELVDGWAQLTATTDRNQAGVDFDVDGPAYNDIDAVLDSGTLRIRQMEGYAFATASSVDVDMAGGADLLARSGSMQAAIVPLDNVRLETHSGSVTLWLPLHGDGETDMAMGPGA